MLFFSGWLILSCLGYSSLVMAEEVAVPGAALAGESQPPPAAASDEQVKKVLLELLQGEAARTAQTATSAPTDQAGGGYGYDAATLSRWKYENSETNKLATNLRELRSGGLPRLWQEMTTAFALATTPGENFHGLDVVLTIAMHLALGLILEFFTTRHLLKKLYQYAETQEKSLALKFKFISTRLFIQMLGLGVLAISTYACALFYVKQNPYFETLFLGFLSAFILFRFSMLVARSIFSPFYAPLRLMNIQGSTAKGLYYWSITFFALFFSTNAMISYLAQADMDKVYISGLAIPISFTLNSIILLGVWVMRKPVSAMFVDENCSQYQASFSSRFFAAYWPFFFTAWLLFIWMLWLYRTLQGEPELADAVTVAWVITLGFPVADRLFHGLLKNVIRIPWLQSPSFQQRSTRFVNIVQNGFRVILLAVSVVTILRAWGLNTTDVMMPMDDGMGRQIVHLLVIATVAYVLWELMHALIERKLPEEEDVLASLEGDGGGGGASRAETLLPLIRTTLTVILVIVFALSLLHAAGVAITPLLAGAGVVGIAIGFGAQKLVQDILSGIFFLIDDAFRKGEYIELDGLKGTVERISLRSMQLRHHLGAFQTVPYSEIKTVSNLSRDWVTMKLELRLSYDTDIEKVRKIIKKVGQAMLNDEQLGPSFILPLKSQGVMRVEESALIVRMKFTTRPGEQWVIRREAYRKVRDALADAGIHFAHREVRVLLPGEANSNGAVAAKDVNAANSEANPASSSEAPEVKDHIHLQKVAAAAVTSMLAAEAAKHGLRDEMGGGDDR